MYDNGLQDPELQQYHKELKYSINLFLNDILTGTFSEFFKVTLEGNFVKIYPLFYTDKILTDGSNCTVNSPYFIAVPTDYKGLISFYGEDGQFIESKSLFVNEEDGFCTVMIHNAKTKEFIPNHPYRVEYPNLEAEEFITGENGYGGFVKKEENYNVVII